MAIPAIARVPRAGRVAACCSLRAASSSGISGIDITARGDDRRAIGVETTPDQMSILASIPDANEFHYPGRGNPSPPPADVGVINTLLDPRLRTPVRIGDGSSTASLKVRQIVSSPGWSGTTVLGNMGTSSDYRVVVVNGNCVLESGVGFGILLVRGKLSLTGTFRWNGLILVIGQGSIASSGTVNGTISGGVVVARTRADDRSPDKRTGHNAGDAGSR